jgi:uncharacterized protein (DUF1800 family)
MNVLRFAVASLACVTVAAADRPSAIPVSPDVATIRHVLNRIGYGARPGDIERVRQIGLAKYIEQQLHPERMPDTGMSARLDGFETLNLSSRELADRYFIPAMMERRARQRERTDAAEMDPEVPSQRAERKRGVALAELGEQRILRAIYSERQLNEVLVDFWFNHFNVFAGKGADRIYLLEYERDVIRPRVLGKFRDLLGAVAESPAMLFYLDNWMSADPKMAEKRAQTRGRFGMRRQARPQQPGRTGLPRAQSRGLNENYARELLELHTLGVAGGYTQQDVVEVARAFTGWTIQTPRRGGSYRFEPRMHDDGEKHVLGQRIAAGGGRKDGERVLDIVASHPSTARFIALKLVRRFVADDPPPALVERAAARFRETGGDLRETTRVILTSAEFFAPDTRRAKIKTPLEFVATALRTTGAEVDTAGPLLRSLRDLGMPLYMCQPPTGYGDTAEDWVNSGALLNRMNFAVALAGGTMRGVRVSADNLAAQGSARESITESLLGADVSDATAATLARTTEPAKLVALALGSPEFQRR